MHLGQSMASSGRWQLGDVVLWVETGSQRGAKTDSDVFLNFYDDEGSLLAKVEAYERGDLGGFEEGSTNCGFIGNLHRNKWLAMLLEHGTKLGIRIENVTDDQPEWFVERITLDFRIGPLAENSTCRTWEIGEWIRPLQDENVYSAGDLNKDKSFSDIGFENELEIQARGPA